MLCGVHGTLLLRDDALMKLWAGLLLLTWGLSMTRQE